MTSHVCPALSMRFTCAFLAIVVGGCTSRSERPSSPPGEARAELELSRSQVKIGEHFELRLTCEHPAEYDAVLPALGTELAGLEVVKPGQIRTIDFGAGWRLTERKTVLRGFRPGGYTIGPLDVMLVPASPGKASSPEAVAHRKLSASKVQLEIVSSIGEAATLEDLKPLKGPYEIPLRSSWLGTTVLVVSILFILAAGVLFSRGLAARWRTQTSGQKVRPPHEIALEELKAIRQMRLLEEGRLSEYIDRVSDTLRRYIEARFALPAPERTTEEFLDEMARTPVLDRDRKRFLAEYLERCDLIKFAAAEPSRRELDELFEKSIEFIEQTVT